MRRSKSSKSRKGNKGRGRLTKTRRMRGRGWLSGLFSGSAAGSAAAQSGSAESTAGYTYLAEPDKADGPSAGYAGKPEVVSNMPFTDSYGSGTYTGYVVILPNGFTSRQGTGTMNYANGTTYMGEYQGNERNGTGIIYEKLVDKDGNSVTSTTNIRWNNDEPINGAYTKMYYYDGDDRRAMYSKPVFFGNTVKDYGFEEMADASTGFGMVNIDPTKIQEDLQNANRILEHSADAKPKSELPPPPSTPVQPHNYDDDTPEQKEERKNLVAATRKSIANFDDKLSKRKI